MRGSLTTCVLFCLLSLGLSYPMMKGKPNDTSSKPFPLEDPTHNLTALADRCTDEGFDAMTLDDQGLIHLFRDGYSWSGFRGAAQFINETWNLTVSVDAAFRNHNKNQPQTHQRMYLLQGSDVWGFYEGHLLAGYPRPISQEFPGVPDNVDAAVECHAGECQTDSVIFFKGDTVYIYSPMDVPVVKQRHWAALGPCTAAFRWLERYYCFKGINFTRFDPVSGEVLSTRPLDTRDYFVSCPGRGHGHVARQNATLMSIKNRCSGRPFKAFSSDELGRTYVFRGGWYFRADSSKDGWHAWPLSHSWRNLQGEVDAAFSWENKMYFIQDSQVTIYRSNPAYTPVQGYPKPLQEELGVTEVDAAFICQSSDVLHIIKGNKLRSVDLKQSPRLPGQERPIAHTQVDSAMCNANGIYLFHGPSFYLYKDVEEMVTAAEPPEPGNIAATFLQCTE
ncbi:hemopexin [Ascaphus truei]|uniref:hemopexin n=1 Tax=Ascaphus truei TaxID=8439 RepID=UPI003F5A397B